MFYLNYFFITSILGHFIESFFYTAKDSGILLGYWTPIYGIGAIIILLLYKSIYKLNINKILKIFFLFLLSSIILSILESIGGYLIKFIFNTELWNYTNHKYNIGKYTSLEMSLIWGLSSICFILFIKPILDKLINKIPKTITIIFFVIFVVDIFVTCFIKLV